MARAGEKSPAANDDHERREVAGDALQDERSAEGDQQRTRCHAGLPPGAHRVSFVAIRPGFSTSGSDGAVRATRHSG
jgi:hypothetical protein